jgi:hypothetical protein
MIQELLKEFLDTLRILNKLSSSPYRLLLYISKMGILLIVEPTLVKSNFNRNFIYSIFSSSKSITAYINTSKPKLIDCYLGKILS